MKPRPTLLRTVLALVAILTALASLSACGDDVDLPGIRHIPEDTTYRVSTNERRTQIAKADDDTARELTAAGYYATGRISPGDESKSWRLLLTRCDADANGDTSEKCNKAEASFDQPKIYRDYPGKPSDDFRVTGYSSPSVRVDMDEIFCDSTGVLQASALKALPAAARTHTSDKSGTSFDTTDTATGFKCYA